MDLHQFSESDGLPQIEKVWELDVNELVIEDKPFARGAFSQVYKVNNSFISKPARLCVNPNYYIVVLCRGNTLELRFV